MEQFLNFFNMDLHVAGVLAWLALAVIFGIIEGFTLGLTTIWFAAGSIVAGVVTWFKAPIYIQIIVFVAVSLILLLLTRPLVKKKLNLGHSKDITEALIGRTAMVIEDIAPFKPGQAKINGLPWTAVSQDLELPIEKGREVKVVAIEGVKLIVAPLNNHIAVTGSESGREGKE